MSDIDLKARAEQAERERDEALAAHHSAVDDVQAWRDRAERAEAGNAALLMVLERMEESMRDGDGCECGGAACEGHDSTCVLRFIPRENPSGAALLERLRALEEVLRWARRAAESLDACGMKAMAADVRAACAADALRGGEM